MAIEEMSNLSKIFVFVLVLIAAVCAFSTSEARTYILIGPDGKEYQSPEPGKFGGHRQEKIFGALDCRTALMWIRKGHYVKYRVFFLNEWDALNAGYRPCKVCLRDFEKWKLNFPYVPDSVSDQEISGERMFLYRKDSPRNNSFINSIIRNKVKLIKVRHRLLNIIRIDRVSVNAVVGDLKTKDNYRPFWRIEVESKEDF